MPTITESVDQKKARLAKELIALSKNWPVSERQLWASTNGYNAQTVYRNFLCGTITSIPVAEKLIETIELYMKNNNIES